ncbi:MAG: GspH/FimT family pseudopilin [Pseudomonadota bacterium]|nr:GspH/FimT family pseudopilin [Pseudomonadota bacterium]
MPTLSPPRQPHTPHPRGFTAVELLVVIAILAVLASLAAPSFRPMIERFRVRQASEALQSTLYLARSEAIKRGGSVVVQKLPNNSNGCTTAINNDDWNCGWLVCDTSAVNTCTPGGTNILQRYDTPSTIQVTRSGGGERITLNRWGTVAGTFVGFSIVPHGESTNHPATRGVCMSSGGRIRSTPPADTPCTG